MMNTGLDNGTGKQRTHHIFVDCENVTNIPTALLELKPVEVILVTGRTQKSLSLPLSKNLSRHGIIPVYVESTVPGRNALDFILSFLVGRKTVEEPQGAFHVVSNDHGYDSLIAHLQTQHFDAHRHECPAGISVVQNHPTSAKSTSRSDVDNRDARVRKILGKIAIKGRPAKRKTLVSYIRSVFDKKLPAGQAEAILEKLIQNKFLTITETGAVKYTTAKLTAA